MMGHLVLVVDDSLTICKVIEVALHREGYEVVSFNSAELALDWFKSSQARVPDLLLVDLLLPKMDGFHLIRLFRSLPVLSQVPTVIISRQDGWLDKLKGRLLGVVAYVVKPFATERLVSVVQMSLQVPRSGGNYV